MKNSLLVMVMVLFASLSMQAQVNPASAQDSIVFDKMAHDYGTIIQGADGNCEFKFVNKGKAPIILNEVKASCGCTSPDWTRTPVAPGETGTIKVAYNTNIAGAFNKTVTVNSNAKNTPVVLLIKGIVTAKQ
ncbi:MAG: DUF1573 domain-containing protein [Bacteroidota bacterium]|nr:DUF1573 domain-containing protein [Bacteroidota bacterium]